MKLELLKPIPKYIQKIIEKKTREYFSHSTYSTRVFYSYFAKLGKEIVKITVAAKAKKGVVYMKQIALHGLDSTIAYAKDMAVFRIGGYVVDWYDEGLQKNPKWYYTGKWCKTEDKLFDPFAIPVNLDFILRQPEFKYCAIDKAHVDEVIKYLRLYRQFPHMEILAKAGFYHYCLKIQLLRKVAKDKGFRSWIMKNKDEILRKYLPVDVILYSYNHRISLDAAYLLHATRIKLKDIGAAARKFWRHREVVLDHYLCDQGISVGLYRDYFDACDYLGINMTDTKNCMPHDFMYWHDARIDQKATLEAERYEVEHAEEIKQFAAVSERYASLQFTENGYTLIIAKSRKELIQEGISLDHCVGRMNYDRKMMKGESLIFFLRKDTDIDKPLVTMEFSPSRKCVLQLYAYHNTAPSDEIKKFVQKLWLPYAKKALKKIA